MFEMTQAFLSGLYQVFTWSTFSLMLIGIFVGFCVGILPGLGGPTTLALMLPFIFKMTPVEAFAFLLGITAVTNTTGDITSILFGVPGEPTTAATIVDGHPMAKKGEAGRALGAALMSSLVGAIFGALCLALAIPIVRPLVLTFGSPEFFMLALLGVAFVASLSGEDLLKGLISGGLGYLLATVGLDPVTGIERYTFGQLFLWDGIGLVPVTIGLFAFAEMIDLAVGGTSIARMDVGKLGGVMEGVKDTFRHFWLVIRCSAIGAYIGVIPGMGGSVSQWVAYAHAQQTSRVKEQFGKGAVEGVLGPGAANNSTLGGALIPTIAFGVPGSVVTAILLGAFIIHGIVPGPDMLIPEPKGRLSLTFSFVWINILSNLITVGICFLFLKQLAKVTQVRASLLMPAIILLVYVGTFAEKNAFEDLLVVITFGALGWIMVKIDWQRPPMILGLVLGPIMENRLFLSTDNYGIAWLWRPGVIILFAITLFGTFYPLIKERRERKKKAQARPAAPVPEPSWAERPTGFNWSAVFSLVVVAVVGWALWQSRDFGFRAGLFPWAIGFPVLALAILQLGREIFLGRKKIRMENGPGRGPVEPATVAGPQLAPAEIHCREAVTWGWIIGFLAAIWFVGFSYGVAATTFLYLKIAGREKWPIAIALTLISWGFFYGLFERILHMPFPEGQLFLWLRYLL